MNTLRKITIQIPDDLLKKAMKASHEGITPTIRRGLELVTASAVYEQLTALKGKVKFSVDLKKLREDRS